MDSLLLPVERIAQNFDKLTALIKSIAGGSKNPSDILEASTSAMFIVGIITLVACFLIPAPYGKHIARRGKDAVKRLDLPANTKISKKSHQNMDRLGPINLG
jgi:hypothetical protein